MKEVVVESQEIVDLPENQQPPLYRLIFKPSLSGDFQTSIIEEESGKKIKRIKLKEKIILTEKRLDSTTKWISNNKTSFSLDDLYLDPELHKIFVNANQKQKSDSLLKNFVVSTDTFNFCNSFDPLRYLVNASKKLHVTFKYENSEEKVFEFDFVDFYKNKFNLQDYLMVYPLLKDKLPTAYIQSDFFSEETLLKVLRHYIKTIDCEGYYYDEFIKAHPERTAQENRMRVDWNFEEYMRNRDKQ